MNRWVLCAAVLAACGDTQSIDRIEEGPIPFDAAPVDGGLADHPDLADHALLGDGGADAALPDAALPDAAVGTILRIRISDEHGAPVAARVVVQAGSSYLAPAGAKLRARGVYSLGSFNQGYQYFYADGSADVAVPAGQALDLQVFRGLEYTPVRRTVTVPANTTMTVDVPLTRWIDEAALGWYSGDTHVHLHYSQAAPETACGITLPAAYNPGVTLGDAQTMARGEDLHVTNLLIANRASTVVFDQAAFTGAPVEFAPGFFSAFNEEYRAATGHAVLLGVTALALPPFSGNVPGSCNPGAFQSPLVADIADGVHNQTVPGAVSWAHPFFGPPPVDINQQQSWELPVVAALGGLDAMDVLHPTANEDADLAMYYKLLDTGSKLSLSGGTDAELDNFFLSVAGDPIGGDRVYASVTPPFSYAKWIDALRAHRTFASDGPMLELTVDGRPIGDTLTGRAAGNVRVVAHARAPFPIHKLEVVVNGVVVDQTEVAAGASRLDFDKDVALTRSSWLAVRVVEPVVPDVIDSEVFAHTSPIWVLMGADTRVSILDDAIFLRDWVDAVSLRLGSSPDAMWASAAEKTRVLGRLATAKTYYAAQAP